MTNSFAGRCCLVLVLCAGAAPLAFAAGPREAAGGAALPPCPAGTSAADDVVVAGRVRLALHADRYLLDRHIRVSADKGVVVLEGFVSSDWDLQAAIRVANQAACSRRVVDELSIQVGGQR